MRDDEHGAVYGHASDKKQPPGGDSAEDERILG
jgi:hypothetical protein